MVSVQRVTSGTVPVLTTILLLLLGFAIQAIPMSMVIAIGVVAIYLYFNWQSCSKGLRGIGLAFLVSGGIWLFFRPLVFWIVSLGLLILFHAGVWLKLPMTNRWLRWGKGVLVFVLSALFVGMQLLMVKPGIIVPYVQQKIGHVNSYQALSLPHPKVSKDINVKWNVSYGQEYPRSFLDVFTKKGQSEAPTVVYLHGGGWIAGDKSAGDPNQSARDTNYQIYHFEKMVHAGYNVVSLNYALAPAYPYPTQLKQISQAVSYLQAHEKELGIGMDKVIVSGSSAGGNLAADFVTLQVNPHHPQAATIQPVLSKKALKAMVLEVPALDMTQVNHTYRPLRFNDYVFGISVMTYTKQPMVSYDEDFLAKISPINYVTKDLPPTFIADGNLGSFMKSNLRYYEKLQKAGVKSKLYIPSVAEGDATHGFLAEIGSPMTETYLKMKFAFLKQLQ